jgi:chemotaxis response regulator CheB
MSPILLTKHKPAIVNCPYRRLGDGFEAIQKLVASFPPDLKAAIFVTIHMNAQSDGMLPRLIDRSGPLPASHALDGEAIAMGRIYVAPPISTWSCRPAESA